MSQADSITPVGVNHVVLNVRDIEESHRFWTEIVGLKQVSELRRRPEMPNIPKMRFYSGKAGLAEGEADDLCVIAATARIPSGEPGSSRQGGGQHKSNPSKPPA